MGPTLTAGLLSPDCDVGSSVSQSGKGGEAVIFKCVCQEGLVGKKAAGFMDA